MRIILEREKSGFYKIKEYDNEQIEIIAYFLTDDVGSDTKNWKEWLLHSSYNTTSSNASILRKDRENNVSIETWWIPEGYEGEREIELTQQQFLYLLDQWDKLRKIKAQEIIITLREGKLTVEGNNPHPVTLTDR